MAAPDPESRRWIEELKYRQRNIVWPDAFTNSREVLVRLWRGSRGKATLTQRVGVFLFGLMYFAAGLGWIVLAHQLGSILGLLISYLFLVLGARSCWNAVRKRRPDEYPRLGY